MWVRIIIGADHEFRAKLWSEFDPSTETVNHGESPSQRVGIMILSMLISELLYRASARGKEGCSESSEREMMRSAVTMYICIDGDGAFPVESAKADGLDAVASVGVPAKHRGIICRQHVSEH
ncbi:PGAP1-like protein [Musa troglodytarum]|uniref:PGAP1-like protein n=1 Tax=Musa troglodytarum TaxID=320322 RepID=A0A9E7F6Z6_9LILI|nr:PGAP1-like protein [Musa troglodytarum]